MSENARNPASVLEPLLDRIQELDEARGSRDEADTSCRHAQYARHILADVSPMVVVIHGLSRAGKSELALRLSELSGCSQVASLPAAPETSPPGETIPRECGDLIGVLDEIAAAALIVRSSLGTPAASRIRRGTSPARIAEILRRRDQLQSGAGSEPSAADDAGSTQFPTGQDHALDDRDAVTVTAPDSRDGTTCADALDQVDDYLACELPAEERAKVKQHLETCSPCLRKYSLWLAVNLLVKKHCGCDPAPPDLRAKVMARIHQIAEASQPEP